MMSMEEIQRQDLNQISYGQFGIMLDKLMERIQESCKRENTSFDLVVPILRSGAFTGIHVASKLAIKNILPMQYKYIYFPKEYIIKKFEPPKLDFEVSENANILVADTNTVFGEIAGKVIEDVHSLYPLAKLYFASANIDVSLKILPYVSEIFYGEISNEARTLSRREAEEKGITNDIIIFPWENIEEQWQEISASS